MDWSTADRYGLVHLAWHVLGAADPVKGRSPTAIAMAMLEQATDTLVRVLGVRVGAELHAALVRALRCSSPSGIEHLPDIDGVLTRLAA